MVAFRFFLIVVSLSQIILCVWEIKHQLGWKPFWLALITVHALVIVGNAIRVYRHVAEHEDDPD